MGKDRTRLTRRELIPYKNLFSYTYRQKPTIYRTAKEQRIINCTTVGLVIYNAIATIPVGVGISSGLAKILLQ